MKLGEIVAELKKKPGRHLTAFLVLHELTAILAFPLVYPLASLSNKWLLQQLPESILIKTQDSLKKANSKVNSIREYFGYTLLDDHHPVVINFATSYAFVKILMPIRLGICVWMTPIVVRFFSRV